MCGVIKAWEDDPLATQLAHHKARVELEKALDPLNDKDYVQMVMALANSIHRSTAPTAKTSLEKALAGLDVDWRGLSDKQSRRLVQATKEALLEVPDRIIPLTRQPLTKRVSSMVRRTRLRFSSKFRKTINHAFTEADQDMVGAINSVGFFVRDEYNRRADVLSKSMQAILKNGLASGTNSSTIANRMREEALSVGVRKPKAYWVVTANNAMNQARSFGLLTGMRRSGVEVYRWASVLDEKTTPICRLLDGKVFRVDDGLNHFAEIRDTYEDDPLAVTKVTPFVRETQNEDGTIDLTIPDKAGSQILIATVLEDARGRAGERGSFRDVASVPTMTALGLTFPPIHHHCRSTVIPDT